MPDLGMVRALGDDTPLPEAHELAPARDRLLAAIAAEPVVETRDVRRVRRRWPVRRFAFAGWATAGLAAAATAVIVLVPGGASTDRRLGGGTALPPGGAASAPVMLPAAQVLENAASAALKAPTAEPRDNQFVWTRSTGDYDGRRIVEETWISVDGTRDGLTLRTEDGRQERNPLPGCRAGRRAVVKGDGVVSDVSEPCTPDLGYPRHLPTDRDAMVALLRKDDAGRTPASAANHAAKTAMGYASSYLRPAQRAALFRAVATIPGLTVVPNVVDAAGRRGVGIHWTLGGTTGSTMIFDAGTYEFVGMAGAKLDFGVVDKVGQRLP